jgi:hypothetical protein
VQLDQADIDNGHGFVKDVAHVMQQATHTSIEGSALNNVFPSGLTCSS